MAATEGPTPPSERLRPHAWHLPAGLVTLGLFMVGLWLAGGIPMELGSVITTVELAGFIYGWLLVGTLAVALVASGLAARSGPSLPVPWQRGTDRQWVVGLSLFAFLASLAIRVFVLQSTDMLDDDGAYRFSAELLAGGQLKVASPPLKLFFDRSLVVNDGHMYSQYFLGWPAMLVPGIWVGNTDWVNPLYLALTVPGIFAVARRCAVQAHNARLAALLYATSPMVLIASATHMSHTANLLLLTWAIWAGLRSMDDDGHAGHAFGFGLLMACSFFVRPQEVITLMFPMGLAWLWHTLRGRKFASLVSFTVPAALLAVLFFWVNQQLTGDPLESCYLRYWNYRGENHYRFNTIPIDAELFMLNPIKSTIFLFIAMFRMNFAMFGWPISFFLLAFAPRNQHRWAWWMLLFYVVTHFFATDPGNAIAGPIHFFEMMLPIVWLSVTGFETLQARAEVRAAAQPSIATAWRALPRALVIIGFCSSVFVSTPLRLYSLRMASDLLSGPTKAVAASGVTNAVVFSDFLRVGRCPGRKPRTVIRLSRDLSSPWFDDDVIWVNHINGTANARLMREVFPDREGYTIVRNDDCSLELAPITDPRAQAPTRKFGVLEEPYWPEGYTPAAD